MYYKFELHSKITQNSWKIEKRFSELIELYTSLKDIMFNLPPFPYKTFLKVKSIEEITKRKNELDHFFKVKFYYEHI